MVVSIVLSGPTWAGGIRWKHLSSTTGDLPVPNGGKEQTASLVCDIDKDGVNDFVIAERTQAPALVWYRRTAPGWTKYVVEDQPLHIEAGSDSLDIDGDGDLDIWVAEMRLNNGNPDAKNMLLLGDGTGKFQTVSISEGIANHESRIADLDGDGDYDVLGKPYAWQTPRLDIWLNEGTE